MAYEIIWADHAKENYRNITDFLLEKWSFEVAETFTDSLMDRLETLAKNPFIGTPHQEISSLRKFLIPPHNYVYYTVVNQQLIVMNIVDTRRNTHK